MFKNITGFFVRKKDSGDKKKLSNFENLVVIVVIGVIIVMAVSFLSQPGSTKDVMKDASSISSGNGGDEAFGGQNLTGQEVVADLEKRLSELLSQVEGAGQVSVMIYADSSSEQVPAYNDQQNTKNEDRNDGKSSEINETRELALSGNDSPVILKVMIPQIKGVVVVAEGADDMLIKEQLNNAVCTLLGIPEHRVQILKHK
ncbi:MAG: hypothetical protein N2376_04885 [Clostridia bacterium]|nr:hypothetical protein [Clostridia bacterium]